MPPQVTLKVDVLDALAKRKLTDLGIQADKLNTKKIVIKSDLQGNAEQRIIQLKGAEGQLVTMNERWLKSGKQVTSVTQQVTNATKNAGDAAEKTATKFSFLNTAFLRLAHAGISAVTRSFREALTEMKNVDSELVVVRKVSNASAEELAKLRDRAFEVGAAYGVAASDYLSAAAEMTRAGYRESAGDLAELATKLQLVGDVSQDTANQFLIATDKAYKMNGDMKKLSDTIDKLNEIDNNYATSIQKVADGIGILAPIASQTHVSFEQMAAALGTITAVTQRSGSESARALRSLFLNIARDTSTEIEEGVTWTVEEINNLQDALKKYAPEVVKAAEASGELINPMEAIGALAKSFEEGILDEQKLMEIVSGLGGKLRSSQLLALIQNWDMYNEMLKTTADAAGSADKEVQNALDSWQVKLQQLKNVFTQFVANTIDVETIKKLLDAVNGLVSVFGKLGKVLIQVGAAFVALKVILSVINFIKTLNAVSTITGQKFKALILTLANYKTMSSAAGKGTEALSSAVTGASAAASAAAVAFGVLTAAISIGILIYNKIKQKHEEEAEALRQEQEELERLREERRQQTVESGKQAEEEYKNVSDLKDKYDELKKTFDEGKGGRNNYLSAQEEIVKTLKEEGSWVEDTAGKYQNLTDKINESTEAYLNKKKKEMLFSLPSVLDGFSSDNLSSEDVLDVLNAYGYRSLVTSAEYQNKFGYYSANSHLALNGIDVASLLRIYDQLIEDRDRLGIGETITKQNPTFPLLPNYEFNTGRYLGEGLPSQVKTEFTGEEIQQVLSVLEPQVNEIRKYLGNLFPALSDEELDNLRKQYPQLAGEIDRYVNSLKEDENIVEDIVIVPPNAEESIEGLSDKLEKATNSLDKYKKALESGEKGDTLKSYAKAYKDAMEMFDKGLTGSNAYKAAVDMLIPKDVMRRLQYDYEAAGEILGSDFYRALFEGGGDDFGANAANYIRNGIESGLYEGVKIIEDEATGTFSVAITDMDAFSKSVGMSSDALWAWLDALDAFDSQTLYTNEELEALINNYKDIDGVITETADGVRQINLSNLLQELIKNGTTEDKIYGIIDALRTLATSNDDIELVEPSNIEETIDLLTDANKQVDDYNDKHLDQQEITLTSNADEFFGDIYTQIDQLNGQTVYIKIRPQLTVIPESSGSSAGLLWKNILSQIPSNANGTKSSRGGLSLVNDGGGAELISANGKAWIAGGGEPTITNLPVGATVFNAEQTRQIFARSGIPAYDGGTAGGISTTPSESSSTGSSSSGGKRDRLDDLLKELDKYIDDLLKKAKKALDAQLKAIDEQIEALQREHDAEEDKNKLEELRLRILEAEKKLAEAQSERTVRYFNKETGQWEWMADQKAVADAQKELEKAQEAYDKEVAEQEYQAQIQALKDEKESLQESYNELSTHWQEIYDALAESKDGTVNLANLLERLGLSSGTEGDIRELVSAIQEYESSVSSGTYSVPLDSATASAIMRGAVSSDGSGFLSRVFGISTADTSARGASVSSSTSSIVGDTIYYINGVKIGSDMMDRPLSQILSVLPIYAS